MQISRGAELRQLPLEEVCRSLDGVPGGPSRRDNINKLDNSDQLIKTKNKDVTARLSNLSITKNII